MNPQKKIWIEKLTLNVGAGKDTVKLDKSIILLKNLTGIEPVKTVTNKRIPGWGLRPGLPIGCKLTIRKEKAKELFKQLIGAKENQLKNSQVDEFGNIAFGIHEYIDIPGIKYFPEIGIIGFQVCVTLARNGYRVKERRLNKSKISSSHRISKQDAIDYLKNEFNIMVIQ